jgi:hypothetical protein
MQAVNFVNLIALACAIAAAVTVGRRTLLKQTISAQADLITALQNENAQLKDHSNQQDRRIEVLEAIVRANPGLVGSGHLASGVREGRGNRPTHSKSPKNRNP